MSSLDSLIRNADEIQALFEKFKAAGGQAMLKATETGVSGNKIFKVVSISANKSVPGSSAENAIDGKAGTVFEGEGPLLADLGGIAEIVGLEIKFKGGPFDFKIETSFEGNNWFTLPVFSSTSENMDSFERFVFSPSPVVARHIRISPAESGDKITIRSLEVIGELKNKPPERRTRGQQGVEFDEFGIKKIAKDAPGGKFFKDMNFKFSVHDGTTRHTFSKEGVNIMNMECTGYYKINLSDNTEELSNKIYGGNHGGDGDNDRTRQGRCYCVGVQQDGKPSFKKEFPHHSDTPDFSERVKIADGMPGKLNSLKNRWIGQKVIAWPDQNAKKVNFQFWIDDDGLVNEKPANNWKLWYTAEDKGDLHNDEDEGGEPYLELQGSKHGGKDIYFMRIDTVPDDRDAVPDAEGISVREIIPPNA